MNTNHMFKIAVTDITIWLGHEGETIAMLLVRTIS